MQQPSYWDRFWNRVDASGDCWVWTGYLQNGYGQFELPRQANGRRKVVRPHRLAYELLVGAVPTHLDLDHLCRARACVNPDHLEPVTRQTNVARGQHAAGRTRKPKTGTHCQNGHRWTEDTTYIAPNGPGYRQCMACIRARNRGEL